MKEAFPAWLEWECALFCPIGWELANYYQTSFSANWEQGLESRTCPNHQAKAGVSNILPGGWTWPEVMSGCTGVRPAAKTQRTEPHGGARCL